jgi:ADP-ribose pyrophosphatase YjhB (NUDIX family)
MAQHKKDYKDPIPTVDLIVRDSSVKKILIEKRGRPPFEGFYSLPGGHVDYGETVEQAALRELKEECSISARLQTILGVYSDPNRDPRGQRISVVFISDYAGGNLKAGDDAKSAEWIVLEEILSEQQIAFDHKKILGDYQEWLDDNGTTFWSTK